MPVSKRGRKQTESELAQRLDGRAVYKLALLLEKAKLAEYVTLMARPWRNIYINFLAGVARGAGMVVGASLVGGLLVLLTVQSLKYVAHHSDMLPWIGDRVKAGVGFILNAVEEQSGRRNIRADDKEDVAAPKAGASSGASAPASAAPRTPEGWAP